MPEVGRVRIGGGEEKEEVGGLGGKDVGSGTLNIQSVRQGMLREGRTEKKKKKKEIREETDERIWGI